MGRAPELARQVVWLVVLALAYWTAARVGLSLALVHGQVTPLWPPTGIAVVALLKWGRRVWPGIALGAFAVNLPIGPSPLGAAVIAAGNTLAPLAAAELLRRLRFEFAFRQLRDALALIAAALIGMTVSATVGTTTLVLAGATPSTALWSTWAVWWTGDAMGVLLVAPFLISLLPQYAHQPHVGWRHAAELAAILLVTGGVTYAMFLTRLPVVYLAFPFVMIAGWRFALRGAAPAALLASITAIWMAVNGIGRFSGQPLLDKMISLQAFNVGLALSSFLLVALVEAERRKQEVSRLYMAAQLASETKSAFLNMAAHELRTPISVLNGYLSLLTDGSLGSAPAHFARVFDTLAAKTNELNKIVRDLLDASQIEARSMSLNPTRIDLRQVVAAAVERARPRAELLGGDIGAELDSEDVSVDADAEHVGRILDNLINNALTYTERPPHVGLTVAPVNGHALVQVTDNGVGIPSEQRERIFDRFQRATEPGFRNIRGTGLGLYISRQLAESQHGTLRVERSEPGQGTVFALALPLALPTPISGGQPPSRPAVQR